MSFINTWMSVRSVETIPLLCVQKALELSIKPLKTDKPAAPMLTLTVTSILKTTKIE